MATVAFGGGNRGTIPVICERAGKAHVKIRTTSNEIIHIHIDAYVSKVRLLSWLKLRKDLSERWLVSLTDAGSMTVLELTDVANTTVPSYQVELDTSGE